MGDNRPPVEPVSRSEFYQTAAITLLLPALMVLSAADVPDRPLRQVSFGLCLVAAVGLSVWFIFLSRRYRAGGPR